MTIQVLFVQGGGKRVHDEWDNKIVDSLERELGPDYTVRYPRMPNEANPTYADWKAALKREFAGFDDGAILIGHSIGGTILIRTIADDPPKQTIGGIFLIAAPYATEGQADVHEPLTSIAAWQPDRWCLRFIHVVSDTVSPFSHA
jgi:predicted alpha/beta hydrolase family esterase